MSDEADPPRRFYRLKGETEFARANPAKEAAGGEAQGDAPIDVYQHLRSAAATNAATVNSRKNLPPERNEVHAMLAENLARANAAGLNNVPPPRKKISKRTRDYVALMIGGNAALLLAFVSHPVFGGAGLVLFNVALTWVMWGVMDKY